MIAVTIRDGAVSAAEQPDPVAGSGELLVRVRAAGLNGADILQRKGAYPAPPGYPQDIPGLEFAGEVVATGEGVTRFSPGDRVMAITGGGGQAELATVHERIAVAVPDALDWPAAGGFAEAFFTAHDALFAQAALRPGEHLLVNGAAGGVGTAAIQLAGLTGARVTASVRDESLHAAVKLLGADEVVVPDGVAEAGEFDVVLELVGAPNIGPAIKSLATGGRIVVIGVGAGFKAEVNLLGLMNKRATLGGSTLRARPLEEKAAVARAIEREVLPALAAGRLKIPIVDQFPLAEVDAAYERFTGGGKFGKIVLTT
jgi:NADPH:quinone reductase-like Zn-dependent oxidoreductase